MEGSDNTSRRGFGSSIYTECFTRDAIPWGEVTPASEEVERPLRLVVFVGFFLLLFDIVVVCRVDVLVDIVRRNELRCAGLDGEGGRGRNEGGLRTSGSTTRITNAVVRSVKSSRFKRNALGGKEVRKSISGGGGWEVVHFRGANIRWGLHCHVSPWRRTRDSGNVEQKVCTDAQSDTCDKGIDQVCKGVFRCCSCGYMI